LNVALDSVERSEGTADDLVNLDGVDLPPAIRAPIGGDHMIDKTTSLA
jgi:hypothetical protein